MPSFSTNEGGARKLSGNPRRALLHIHIYVLYVWTQACEQERRLFVRGAGSSWKSSAVGSGSEGSFQDVMGKLGFLFRHGRRTGSHLDLRCGTQCSSQVVTGTSGFLSSCSGELWDPLNLKLVSQASS